MLLPRADFSPPRSTFLIHPAQQRSRPRSGYIFDRLAMLYTLTRCLNSGYRDDCQQRIIHVCPGEPTMECRLIECLAVRFLEKSYLVSHQSLPSTCTSPPPAETTTVEADDIFVDLRFWMTSGWGFRKVGRIFRSR